MGSESTGVVMHERQTKAQGTGTRTTAQ